MSQKTWARKVSSPRVKLLIGIRVSPNRLTSARLVTGFIAIDCFASSAMGWGGPLFIISAVLDRADRELAPLPGKTSRVGHYYDLCSDFLVYVLLFRGPRLAFAMARTTAGPNRRHDRGHIHHT